MPARIWSKGTTLTLFVGGQTNTDTMEINIVFPQKTENSFKTQLGHIPKKCSILPEGHLLKMFIVALTTLDRNSK